MVATNFRDSGVLCSDIGLFRYLEKYFIASRSADIESFCGYAVRKCSVTK